MFGWHHLQIPHEEAQLNTSKEMKLRQTDMHVVTHNIEKQNFYCIPLIIKMKPRFMGI